MLARRLLVVPALALAAVVGSSTPVMADNMVAGGGGSGSSGVPAQVRQRVLESPKVDGRAAPLFDGSDAEFTDLVDKGTIRNDEGHAIKYFTFDPIAGGRVLAIDWWIRQETATFTAFTIKELGYKFNSPALEGDDRGYQHPLKPGSGKEPRVFTVLNLEHGRGMVIVANSCWAKDGGWIGAAGEKLPNWGPFNYVSDPGCSPARDIHMVDEEFNPLDLVELVGSPAPTPTFKVNVNDDIQIKDWKVRRTNLFHVATNGTDELYFEAHAVNSKLEGAATDMDFVFTRNDSGRWQLSRGGSDGYPAVSIHHYGSGHSHGRCVAYLKGGGTGNAAPEWGDRHFDNPVGGCPQ